MDLSAGMQNVSKHLDIFTINLTLCEIALNE